MATATLAKPVGALAFPAADVEARLRAALVESTRSTAALHGVTLPEAIADQYAASIRLDSLEVVALLCDVEPIVGFELKDSIVKSGGYPSIDKAVGHIMPRIEVAWRKHADKKGQT